MLPIFQILSNDAQVKALLQPAGSRLRVWPFGYATELEVGSGPDVKPYCVWRIPADEPEHLLTCQPMLHSQIYQFDVYARAGGEASAINSALQYAVRLYGNIQLIRHPEFETDGTKLFRAGFDLHYILLTR